MSFSFKNVRSMFRHVLDKILDPHAKYALAFIDDIATHSSTFDEHLRHVDAVLKTIGEAGMTLHVKKCQFAGANIICLDHNIGCRKHQSGIRKLRQYR